MSQECVEAKRQPQGITNKNNRNSYEGDSTSRTFVKAETISKMQELKSLQSKRTEGKRLTFW